ncbi:MAG: hypothetical protein IJB06_05570 [Bacteroidales bacterium]|nr:hypothetical protein [Bacteroidales bacterium]
MKKHLSLLSVLFIMSVSCQTELIDIPDIDELSSLTKSFTIESIDADTPIVFLPEKDKDIWTRIETLEDRFAACSVSQERLDSMTTEALGKSILNYPLNYLVFVYNDPMYAIDLIIKNSAVHRELLSRDDAAETMVDLYTKTTLDKNNVKSSVYGSDSVVLSYTNTIFLDYFMASGFVNSLDNIEVKQELTKSVKNKLSMRLQESDKFSSLSINPLLSINKVESLDIDTKSTKATTTRSIYTYFGQELIGYVFDEATPYELDQMTIAATTYYPDAIIRGPATRRYNCHSYAWHDSSTDNDVWLNATLDDFTTLQLSKYWTKDLYISCTATEAEKVHYPSGDHSAIKLSNGNYLSKWGQWPLMEHTLTYCPYYYTDINYYKERLLGTNALTVHGNTTVYINQANDYYVTYPSDFPPLDITWEVRYMDFDEPKPFEFYKLPGTGVETYRLKCEDYGLFKIEVKGYCNGHYVARNQLNVVAIGS